MCRAGRSGPDLPFWASLQWCGGFREAQPRSGDPSTSSRCNWDDTIPRQYSSSISIIRIDAASARLEVEWWRVTYRKSPIRRMRWLLLERTDSKGGAVSEARRAQKRKKISSKESIPKDQAIPNMYKCLRGGKVVDWLVCVCDGRRREREAEVLG